MSQGGHASFRQKKNKPIWLLPVNPCGRLLESCWTLECAPEEVFRIETANLDFVQRTIFNPFGKTAAARRKITMTEEVWSILKKRTVSSKNPYVFSSPDNPEKPIGSVRKGHDGAVRRAKITPGFGSMISGILTHHGL